LIDIAQPSTRREAPLPRTDSSDSPAALDYTTLLRRRRRRGDLGGTKSRHHALPNGAPRSTSPLEDLHGARYRHDTCSCCPPVQTPAMATRASCLGSIRPPRRRGRFGNMTAGVPAGARDMHIQSPSSAPSSLVKMPWSMASRKTRRASLRENSARTQFVGGV